MLGYVRKCAKQDCRRWAIEEIYTDILLIKGRVIPLNPALYYLVLFTCGGVVCLIILYVQNKETLHCLLSV